MCIELEGMGCEVRIAIAGKDSNNIFGRDYVQIFLIKKKYLRILSFWIFGYIKFLYTYFVYKPDVVILDIYSVWFSIPFAIISQIRSLFIVDNRTPFYNLKLNKFSIKDKIMKFYTKLSYWYSRLFLDGLTVITNYYKHQICKSLKFDSSLIGVWGSGVNTDQFSPQSHADDNRPSFLKGKFVLMQHGDMSYNRGLFETIEAVRMIDKEDIILVLIGDGKAKNEILKQIKKHGLERKIYILPPVRHFEIPAYISYCNCAIMAYPNIEYWNNNNPIKLLEYLAMGKVVICTDMWTFRDVAGNKKCSYYIKNNNPETIAKAINYFYKNKKFLKEWGKEGVDIIKQEFTWHNQAKKLIDFIEQLQDVKIIKYKKVKGKK